MVKFGRWWSRLGRDDRGVTAVEYVVIICFLAAMIFPFAMKASTALWSNPAKMGSSSSVIGRGPYNYPDGDVPGAHQTAFWTGNVGPIQTSSLMAKNVFLYQEASISYYASVPGSVDGPIHTVPYIPGILQPVTLESGHVIYLGGYLAGGARPALPTNPAQNYSDGTTIPGSATGY